LPFSRSFVLIMIDSGSAELGYPAELVAKEVVRREWRAWYDAYKSKAAH
jgi:hypothetical protein